MSCSTTRADFHCPESDHILSFVTGQGPQMANPDRTRTSIAKGIPDGYRMPQYRIQLNDEQIAQVLSYVRSGWGNDAAPVTTDAVKKLRPMTDPSSDRVIILKMR